jgi:hypothetical protein
LSARRGDVRMVSRWHQHERPLRGRWWPPRDRSCWYTRAARRMRAPACRYRDTPPRPGRRARAEAMTSSCLAR